VFSTLTIAHTIETGTPDLDRLRLAIPGSHLVYTSLESATRLIARDPPQAFVVRGEVLATRTLTRLAEIKARYPWLVVLALVPAEQDLLIGMFELGHAGADDFLVAGADSRSPDFRTTLERAGLRATAAAITDALHPLPAALAHPNLVHVLQRIAELKRPHELAAQLDVRVRNLEKELRQARLFTPKNLLARFRITLAAQRLGVETGSAEQIALSLEYASGPTLRRACRHLLGVKATEVREQGGLRFAWRVLTEAARDHRAKLAG